MQQQGNRQPVEHQSAYCQTAPADAVSARRHQRRPQASETRHRHVYQGAGATMPPRDRLTVKEVQVATLVWQGLTNKDIAKVLITSEQVVKNYLRTTFDKLGVWTRLELALYVASHGGASWHLQLGNGLLPTAAAWSVAVGAESAAYGDATPKAVGAASRA